MSALKLIWEVFRLVLALPLVLNALKKSWDFMKRWITGLLLVFLSSCVEELPKFDLDKTYRMDIKITADGHMFDGVAVVPAKKITTFNLEFAGDVDMFSFTNCHRAIQKHDAWEKWYNKKKVVYEYSATDFELSRYCPIFLAGFDRDGKQHSFGFIAINKHPTGLQAQIDCNGEKINAKGTGACQSLVGTSQRITFASNVDFSPSASCNGVITGTGNMFEIRPINKVCPIEFRADDSFFTLYVIGYNNVLVRSR